ncbi:MAG: IscS subfamily cysteine desulfurase [Bacteroidota bacterium]|nr:IscS subfamily cysteine desulfurase [Bacteroidota bacterium]MDP4211141.1 IscS subfamily cysteine desulfurase [Bacteroidota bacterium]MDP4249460.1 IscS subfamily cysteine desulfurase [Bacteroidota bacterium]
MLKLPVYLDYNATTPCDPRVLDIMLPYFTEKFGNAASRNHFFGWQAEEAVKWAREQVAALIHALPEEIVFTSGATEADNLAIKGVFEMYAAKGNHIITVATEHKAVLDTCKHVEKLGADVSFLGVKQDGLLDLEELQSAIRPETILIAVMYANNEIGVLQPIQEISRIAKKHGILFFSDATQAVGKVPVDVIRDGIDLMAFSAHKIYGPKGTGALYVRRKNPRVRLSAQMDGGGHEDGRRSGTLNVPGIVGFGRACEICMNEMEGDNLRIKALRNKLEVALLNIEETQVNGNTGSRLPQVSNISFKYVDDNRLMMGLSKEIAVSSGSACTSASPEPSYVLKAMGIEDGLAHSSLRFGLGKYTSEEEINFTIEQVTGMVKRLREEINNV